MKKYWVSKYLAFIDLDNSILLFNGFSGNIDIVNNAFGKKFKMARSNRKLNFMSKSEFEFMEMRGHITKLSPDKERSSFKNLAVKLHDTNIEILGASSD